ncbi:M14 family zinc carboxypeptidase [Ruminiclostridium cellulolyticum]|uniref:Peptidase M14 carboxypeptidase A n=1 Tax=Ruminiclostridium cellulolyticum (strain ATCC 35319 / DSM 5812 / JCM 6584 / H10) TaxID=394503 RepID=B8I1S4_RUMCH|nr:M14 family zinc carboxypeptidase [Ruminiclostridium cellulolyticum]ACL77709.1 peptidase M14 carboxypeptidase A [Ruminiclostridium cellulolyticum H10]
MSKRIKVFILAVIYSLTAFSTFSVQASKVTYSKSLQQIYKSRDVYKDTQKRLSEFNKNYSNITYLFSAGKSVQKRDLSVLKIGNGSKKIFINAAHHPREYIGTILTLNQIQNLLESYANNGSIDGQKIRNLLDKQVTFYFMPLVNPDGVQICINGTQSYYFNANKVDLNHNYDALWSKKITSTYSTGAKPFSEPETQAVRDLCLNIEFDLTIAYHAAGDIIYWYFGQQGADRTRDLAYANILKTTTGYSLVSSANYKSSTSGFKDWCVQKLKIPSFTIEIGGKRGIIKPVEWSYYNTIWKQNKLVPVRVAKQLMKQTKFNGDKTTALIYKNSLFRQGQILSVNGKQYIAEKAVPMLAGKLSINQQNKLNKTKISIKKTPYLRLETLAECLNLKFKFEKTSNTVYIS